MLRRVLGRATHGPAVKAPAISLAREGIVHTRRAALTGEVETSYYLGGACSEIFAGQALASVLRPGLEYERATLAATMSGRLNAAGPTSATGVRSSMYRCAAAEPPMLPSSHDEMSEDGSIARPIVALEVALLMVGGAARKFRAALCADDEPRRLAGGVFGGAVERD